jgi:light-regulated signal transduction histidine kinase (bacteriophytochrome)
MEKDGERVYFVRDNGAGFDMKFADKIFEPFKRMHSESEFPGTGIGLTIVNKVIRRHGGGIWAQGEIGKGATFFFTLSGGAKGP